MFSTALLATVFFFAVVSNAHCVTTWQDSRVNINYQCHKTELACCLDLAYLFMPAAQNTSERADKWVHDYYGIRPK
ncbi:hypothetical protein LZ30DRAFT_743582 [Colletotrichum cereale]|nr:hypothetical protein LZ30DRAFT_743582 [Colletotrichum cereale]